MQDTQMKRLGLVVAGTDTGVGKTTVTRGLLRALVLRGVNPTPYKPVETGVLDPDQSDAAALRQAARATASLQRVCPFFLRLPVAPVVAARDEGIELSVAALCNAQPPYTGGPLIVESAGGILSPISRYETNADLVVALDFPVLLVGRNSLGTINHCALAVRELRQRRLQLAALVLVNVSPPGPDGSTNASCIADLCGVTASLVMPFLPAASDDELALQVLSSPNLVALMDTLEKSPG